MNTTRPFYTKDLEAIREKLLSMTQEVFEAVSLSMRALELMDKTTAKEVIALDASINELELFIDAECVRYLSLRAPVVMDVRLITFAMRAAQDLERVGDESCSIAKRVRSLIKHKQANEVRDSLLNMGKNVIEHLKLAIDSFIESDVKKAHKVIEEDALIDQQHLQHFKTLTQQDDKSIQSAIDLLFISKSLERVGDHASNLAEEVIYLIEADDVRFQQK